MVFINALRECLGLGPIPGTKVEVEDLEWDAWPGGV